MAAAIALGATTVLAGPTPVGASPAGDGNVLTASNGTDTIRFADGGTLTAAETIKDASWAPDGSQAIYVNSANEVKTIRYDDSRAVTTLISPSPGARYATPSFLGDGDSLVVSVKPSTGPWRLALMSTSSADQPVIRSPQDGINHINPDGGPNGEVVFQLQHERGPVPPAIGMYDPIGGWRTIVEDGSNPSISPDGTRVAYVRGLHIYVSKVDGSDEVQVTSNDAAHDHPVWSPTGSEIAFSQGTQVATALPDGSTAPEPRVVPDLTGIPAYQSRRTDSVLRLAGVNRVGTATAVSQAHWASVGGSEGTSAEAVVLSRSDTFADALGGATLAAAKRGPLLMTSPGSLDPVTAGEIQRILPKGRTVYLLGSTGALSAAVENRVKALGYTVRRLSGADRYATSVAIANAVDTTPTNVFAATGTDFPDALAAGAAAGAFNRPGSTDTAVLVLTQNTTLAPATRTYLNGRYATADFHTIGRQANTALAGYDRSATFGQNRYETAQQTAYRYFGAPYFVGVATGTNWPDALAGGALMATLGGPLLLTDGEATTLDAATHSHLGRYSISIADARVFGGTGIVVPELVDAIGGRISGPGGYLVDGGAAGVDATDLARRPAGRVDKSGSEVDREAIKRLAGT